MTERTPSFFPLSDWRVLVWTEWFCSSATCSFTLLKWCLTRWTESEAWRTRGSLCCWINTTRPVLCESDWVTRKANPQCPSTVSPRGFLHLPGAGQGGNVRPNWHQPSFWAWHVFRAATVLLPKGSRNWDKCFNPRMEKVHFYTMSPFEKPHSLEAKFIVSFCDSRLCFFS